ncbi:MAG: cbb3-type cytochrome c oxidase subunit I, partial [Cryomorphaceae bacterium]|nr:cbb3-type cytochrome c oxidase subunit I [Cryomorphaceae bacterium]MBT6547033.1 cbb3-type cytochrome c oxidase subunit I [Cryomorphaceae bacterium]MBT7018966.1 cbb3-type cytochrome c oxidase subunit I [Cryomorphaceae bacterium]MBT7383813.1 cbb3-type cytochrome c oxidase subunit I [Cryomorphaceae bacterium]MBT7546675.1 cbb3-type cytochrome c oxidase subunit I [Cryomorphaceae bacterium]
MNKKTHFSFLILGIISLKLGLLFGLLAGAQYMVPEFLKEIIPFSQMRELHVTMVISWIILTATGCIYYFISIDNKLAFPKLEKAHIIIFGLTGILILISILTNNMGGREYMTYNPLLFFPIIIGWLLFAINYYQTIIKKIVFGPVYLWMWMTGILFMIITYSEAHLWIFSFFKGDVIKDITVQWKSYGGIVGSWNMLIYGTAIYVMSKIKGDDRIAKGKIAFFFYFLGLTNLMFGWAHHTYIIPHKPWIRILAYGISMTEWIILGSMILNWRKSLNQKQKINSPAYKWLLSTDVWIFLNLVLALLISIPTINLFTHGTHITVAHSMGTTIGINSTILIAAIFYIVSKENKFSLNKYKKRLNIAFWLFHISLLVFWGSLLYSGYLKGIWDQMDMPKTSFSEFITDLKPV